MKNHKQHTTYHILHTTYYVLVLFFTLFLIGCATGPKVADGPIRKVAVNQFDNKTVQYELNIKLTNMITDELLRDARVKVVSEKDAEYVLTGTIKTYELNPISYTENNEVESYEMRIYSSSVLTKADDASVIWEDDDLIGDAMYLTSAGDPNEVGSELDLERESQEKALDYLARDIARKVSSK